MGKLHVYLLNLATLYLTFYTPIQNQILFFTSLLEYKCFTMLC